MGYMYYFGSGVAENPKLAITWFELAAKQGYVSAQATLGDVYYSGFSVPQDYKLAHMWYSIGAANGHSSSRTSRDDVAKKMTSQQISEAQDMARDWMAEY